MTDASLIDLEDESRGVAIAADLREHFARIPGWDFECHISEGAWGVVVRIRKSGLSGRIHRLAVKRALGNGDEEDQLRNEIKWMKVRTPSEDRLCVFLKWRVLISNNGRNYEVPSIS